MPVLLLGFAVLMLLVATMPTLAPRVTPDGALNGLYAMVGRPAPACQVAGGEHVTQYQDTAGPQ